MKAVFAGILAISGVLGAAGPAAAAPISYTITGTILGGHDATQLFGGSQNLAGTAFTVVETFDPAKAQSAWSNASGSGATGNDGGFASVALTIGDVTRRFAGLNSSLSSLSASQFNSNVQNGSDQIGFSIASPQIKADYTLANAIGGLVDRYGGQYTLTDASGAQIAYANFEINGLSVVSAVPLPASVSLFGVALLGLAAVGIRRGAPSPIAIRIKSETDRAPRVPVRSESSRRPVPRLR